MYMYVVVFYFSPYLHMYVDIYLCVLSQKEDNNLVVMSLWKKKSCQAPGFLNLLLSRKSVCVCVSAPGFKIYSRETNKFVDYCFSVSSCALAINLADGRGLSYEHISQGNAIFVIHLQ